MTRLLYIGSKVLGYTEAEVFAMTPRKFYLLYDEHLIYTGRKKRESNSLLDMI